MTGVWIAPVTAAEYFLATKAGYIEFSRDGLKTALFIGLLLMLLNAMINSATYANKKRHER